MAAQKEVKNDRMRNALGMDQDYVEGSAFDRDLQEQRKVEQKVNFCFFVDM